MVVALLGAAIAVICDYAFVARPPPGHSGEPPPLGMTAVGFWPVLILPILCMLFIAWNLFIARLQRNKPPNALFSKLAVIALAVITAIWVIVVKLPHSHSAVQKPLGMTAAGLRGVLISLIVFILLILVLRKYVEPSTLTFMFLGVPVLIKCSILVWQVFRDLPIIPASLLALLPLAAIYILIDYYIRDWMRVRRIMNYSLEAQLETALKGCEERSTTEQGSTVQK
jgi:hypothetical protein